MQIILIEKLLKRKLFVSFDRNAATKNYHFLFNQQLTLLNCGKKIRILL